MSNFFPKTNKKWKTHKRILTDPDPTSIFSLPSSENHKFAIIHRIELSPEVLTSSKYDKKSNKPASIQKQKKRLSDKFIQSQRLETNPKQQQQMKNDEKIVRAVKKVKTQKQQLSGSQNTLEYMDNQKLKVFERNFLKNYQTQKKDLKRQRKVQLKCKEKLNELEDEKLKEQISLLKLSLHISSPDMYNNTYREQKIYESMKVGNSNQNILERFHHFTEKQTREESKSKKNISYRKYLETYRCKNLIKIKEISLKMRKNSQKADKNQYSTRMDSSSKKRRNLSMNQQKLCLSLDRIEDITPWETNHHGLIRKY